MTGETLYDYYREEMARAGAITVPWHELSAEEGEAWDRVAERLAERARWGAW